MHPSGLLLICSFIKLNRKKAQNYQNNENCLKHLGTLYIFASLLVLSYTENETRYACISWMFLMHGMCINFQCSHTPVLFALTEGET